MRKILIKYPSRSRPLRFFNALNSIYQTAYEPESIFVLCTFDLDDKTMNTPHVIAELQNYQDYNLCAIYGESKSKIYAVNRDMDKIATDFTIAADWDILIVFSDDMRFDMRGWDEIVRCEFEKHGSDTLLHIPDQDTKDKLATMYIAGRRFYERFGYIYDPRFKSLWCDNLVMDIAQKLGKYKYLDMPNVISHLNPAYGYLQRDELFNQQQEFWGEDEMTYRLIKDNGYELDKLNYL